MERINQLNAMFNKSLGMFKVTGNWKYADMCQRILEWKMQAINKHFAN